MRIINIVDNVEKVNLGIWSAAISTAQILKSKYNVISELWFPNTTDGTFPVFDNEIVLKIVDPLKLPNISQDNETIIITHGTWRYPTRWGFQLNKKGFEWLYVPQGMMEPWCMNQKKIKKLIYFHLIEKKYCKKSTYVRAVGSPEFKNLSRTFQNTVLIPNGIDIIPFEAKLDTNITKYLFMARLHHKKGVLLLVKAWTKSKLNNDNTKELYIAGPDQGELQKIHDWLAKYKSNNIHLVGSKYGSEKAEILKQCHFYILPSYGEGFPTSVLEAMQNGIIPIISEGCNFPEILENQLAMKTTTSESSIENALNETLSISESKRKEWSLKVWEYVTENYSLENIADRQYELYTKMLSK